MVWKRSRRRRGSPLDSIPTILAIALFLSLSASSTAEGPRQWVRSYDSGSAAGDFGSFVAADSFENVFVAGSDSSENGGDYLVLKYDPQGKLLWRRRYDGLGHQYDYPTGMVVDPEGNVILTGNSVGTTNTDDITTVKYDAHGKRLMVRRVDGALHDTDRAKAIAVDAFGNVIVTGGIVNTSTHLVDWLTISYNPDGSLRWKQVYQGLGSAYDEGAAIAVNKDGEVAVAGRSSAFTNTLKGFDIGVIKYSANGDFLWGNQFSSPSGGTGEAIDVGFDAQSNIVVTGSADFGEEASYDFVTIKYSPAGSLVWYRTQDSGGFDRPSAMAIDRWGNVFVSGVAYGAAKKDFYTVKYSATGQKRWVRRLDGVAHGDDEVTSVAVDSKCNLIVTGRSYSNVSGFDYLTIKYLANGTELWKDLFSGRPGNYGDGGAAVDVDRSDNVLVTGSAWMPTTGYDVVTIKYSP